MSVLKIHISYQCSAECDHCHLSARLVKNKVIDYDLAINTVKELQRLNGLQMVVILGGEPGLFTELLARLIGSISTLNIKTRVETNASWARNHYDALNFLKPYQPLSTHFMFSLDSFHEPFINPQNVVNAAVASHESGLSWSLEIPYIDFHKRDCSYDKRTSELFDWFLKELESETGLTLEDEPYYSAENASATHFKGYDAHIYQGKTFFKGRAIDKLAYLVESGRGVPDDVCDTVPWWSNGSQSTLELLSLDPEGNITKECGIAIGNAARDGIEKIIKSFDAAKHPILSTLIKSGPLGLAKEAESMGYEIKSNYAEKCHLCQEARDVLIAKYPEYLVSSQHRQYGLDK